MLLALLIALQAAPVAGPAAALSPRLAATRPCRSEVEGEVVVCGRASDAFRLGPLPDRYEPRAARAELDLGSGKLAPEVEQGSIGGIPTNRIMLRFRIPL